MTEAMLDLPVGILRHTTSAIKGRINLALESSKLPDLTQLRQPLSAQMPQLWDWNTGMYFEREHTGVGHTQGKRG